VIYVEEKKNRTCGSVSFSSDLVTTLALSADMPFHVEMSDGTNLSIIFM